MDIFSILSLIGGLALFLFGMTVLGDALEKQAGGRFKTVLESMTSSPIKGVLLGAGVTAIIQSSSATTVMVVGFVNSGIMTLNNSVGVIMGANIGTAATAWILSLTGIESSNILLQLCKPANFSPVLAAIGMGLLMFCKKSERKRDLGTILLGFSVLMFGMETMSAAVKPLAEVEGFRNILTLFSNPILGVLTGTLITAVIQSSSASVGILQAMSMTGSITFGTAIPIIMGQNIGTCITALISCVGTNANAKRAAFIHLYFNVLGVIVFLTLYYVLNAIIGFPFVDMAVTPVTIALVHTVFKLVNTAAFLPFTKQLTKLAVLTIKDDSGEERFKLLDERFLSTPAFASARAKELTNNMAEMCQSALNTAVSLVKSGYNEADGQAIIDIENETDMYEDKLGTYMVKLSSRSMSAHDSREVSKLLHCIGDFERIADHSVGIMRAAKEMHTKRLHFSDAAQEEIETMGAAVSEIVGMGVMAFIDDDVELASRVEPLEQVVDHLKAQLKARHISRLQLGDCTIELGFIFSDMITAYERIADHCSNIAAAIIQIDRDSFDTHEYLNTLKSSDDEYFISLYDSYKDKYALN